MVASAFIITPLFDALEGKMASDLRQTKKDLKDQMAKVGPGDLRRTPDGQLNQWDDTRGPDSLAGRSGMRARYRR